MSVNKKISIASFVDSVADAVTVADIGTVVVSFDVDMDNDQASLTVNDVLVHTWPFHYQQANTNGTNQLAGINFYAGSPVSSTTSGTYYVDATATYGSDFDRITN